MEPVSDVKATVTSDTETESVDCDVTEDVEIDSILAWYIVFSC